jgi:hypothetical protein
MIDQGFLYYIIFCGIGFTYLIFYLIYKKNRKTISANNIKVSTSINPALSNNKKIVEIECPFCHNYVKPFTKQKASTGGVIMIIVGVVFTPLLIGIVFIIIGISMKVFEKHCPRCNMKLQ